MKILKYSLCGIVIITLGFILLLTTPILLLVDGGMDMLTVVFEPTVLKNLLTAKVQA